jgi:hypothetical protein
LLIHWGGSFFGIAPKAVFLTFIKDSPLHHIPCEAKTFKAREGYGRTGIVQRKLGDKDSNPD